MKIENIVDTIPNLEKVIDDEKYGIEVHAEMPVVMADAYNDMKKRNELMKDYFKDSMKTVNEFIERNHNKDGFKMVASAPMKKMHLSESLFDDEKEIIKEDVEDVNVDNTEATPDGPKPNTDEVGIASLLINAINDEWKTIEMYNSLISTCAALGEQYADFINVINDIVAEENVHVGQLQKALETISPNVEKIGDGELEAETQLEEPINDE